jgi:Fur family ferric uptake transcriptional regulator
MSMDVIERRINIDVDRATIYRMLNRFYEDGLVHKIIAEDGKQYFAVCQQWEVPKEPHFHFRCTQCETIQCLPILVQFTLAEGYLVDSVNCMLTATYKDCQADPLMSK